MLKWQKNFLTGETVKKPEKIKKKLDAGKFVYDIYLLTLSDNPDNLMDIIPAAMLLQKTSRISQAAPFSLYLPSQ